MPHIMNSPGPLFVSSDNATRDHTYAQDKPECSPALPEATVNTSHVNNTGYLDESKEGDLTSQLPDTMLMRETTSTILHDTTSTDTYELPDKTILSVSESNHLPDATNSIISKRPDKTSSSLPMVKPLPDTTVDQLPDVTIVQVINNEPETLNQMEFEATIKYPTSEQANESVMSVPNTPIKTHNNSLNTPVIPVTSDTVRNEDNHLLENILDLDRSNG